MWGKSELLFMKNKVIDIKKSEIDAGKNLLIASRVTMGLTLASGVTSAILFGVWFKRRRAVPRDSEKIGPISVVAAPSVIPRGGIFVIKGQF